MRCRPPTSTLFPYTTLFRSVLASRLGIARGKLGVHQGAAHRHDPPEDPGKEEFRVARGIGGDDRRRLENACADHQDRKSTRLNSSHTVISYAVFCLKKKKQT